MDNSQDALIASFQTLRIGERELPSRPGFGTYGQPIKLRANFFPINVPKGPLYEYAVAMNPTVSNRQLKRRIFQLAEETDVWKKAGLTGRVAHDRAAKLVASFKIPQPLEIKISYTEEGTEDDEKPKEPKDYVMNINYVQPLETQPLTK